jgi:hypothetical protein
VNYPELEASVVVFDTRNFTDNFKHFNEKNDSTFIEFINRTWQIGLDVAELINGEDKFYINSTGDGFITIFFGSNHATKSYLYGLLITTIMTKKCNDISMSTERKISFGIGIESGFVQKITVDILDNKFETYLGNVINTAARIEAETKSHARAKMIIGIELNTLLVKSLLGQDYKLLMENVKKYPNDPDLAMENIEKMNNLNQQLMLSYIFEHTLKGVDNPVPLFRLSPTLSYNKNQLFISVIDKLLSYDISVDSNKIKEIINEASRI